MGRLTKEYEPESLVFAVRASEVCSSTTETATLGITLPEESVTEPVMPPSVCCATTGETHSAIAAATTSSLDIARGRVRMKYIRSQASKIGFSQRLSEMFNKRWQLVPI